jgi:hypothetical protein
MRYPPIAAVRERDVQAEIGRKMLPAAERYYATVSIGSRLCSA